VADGKGLVAAADAKADGKPEPAKIEAKPEGDRMKKVEEIAWPFGATGPHPNDATPNLNAALVAAVAATPWVEYTKPEKGGGINYEYLSEEDMVKTLRKILPAHGLTIIPRGMELVNKELYNSRNGGRMVNLLLSVTYRLQHTSGEYVEGQAIGEGSDTGDKAANKAMTAAYKYFLRQVFQIAGGIDPDRTASEELARAAKFKGQTGPAQQTTGGTKAAPSNKAGKSEEKKELTPEQKLSNALAYVAKLNSHDDIKAAAKRAGESFANDKDRRTKVHNACASRATLLFTAAVGKAEDLETVEEILKQAEADKIGTDNLKKLRDVAEKRQAEIAGGNSDGDDGTNADEPEPLDF